MNRNGSIKIIKARMDKPDYTLTQALIDLYYVIDYAEGLEDEFREAKEEAEWSRQPGTFWGGL